MILDLYLSGAGAVSPVKDAAGVLFGEPQPQLADDKRPMLEPDYTGLIPPMQLRRMGKAVRTGIAAGSAALASAGLQKPDAISVGTAMGCLHDTEIFLSRLVADSERLLTPTAFIQSTHNTVAGALALHTGCTGHNMTIAQRGHSFESALLDAALYLADAPEARVLVGGLDELTDTSYNLMRRAGAYPEGVAAGEGACFVVVGKHAATVAGTAELSVRLYAVALFSGDNEIVPRVTGFISGHGYRQAGLLLHGANGYAQAAARYETLHAAALPAARAIPFKKVCGDYPTASAFALATLAQGVAGGAVGTGKVVIVNHWLDAVACMLIEVE